MVGTRVKSLVLEPFASALLALSVLLIITVVRFGRTGGLLAAGCFVLSLLAHEAGHVVIATMTGTEVSVIGACWKGVYLRRRWATGATEFLISAAGPAVNFVLTGLMWNGSAIIGWAAQMNAVLALPANLSTNRCSGCDRSSPCPRPDHAAGCWNRSWPEYFFVNGNLKGGAQSGVPFFASW